MKREDLKAKGYTDEQIDHILDEFHKEHERANPNAHDGKGFGKG